MSRRSEYGAAAVEAAIVVPFILLPILAGVVDIGWALAIKAQLHEAAAEGSAFAAHSPADRPGARQRAAATVSVVDDLAAADVNVVCDGGRRVVTTVSYDYAPIFASIFGVGDFNIGARNVSDVLSEDDCA